MPILSQWGGAPWGSIPWAGFTTVPPNTIVAIEVLPSRVAFGAGAVHFPPQQITATAYLPSRVAFGHGALSYTINALYIIPSRVGFGHGAVLGRNYISIFLDGVDVSEYVLVNSVQIQNQLSQATTANFALFDPTHTIVPQVGQNVQIFLGSFLIFAGMVEQPFQTAYQASTAYLYAGSGASSTGGVQSATSGGGSSSSGGVQCTDYTMMLTRRYVGQYYDGSMVPTFMYAMFIDIINKYLAGDGYSFQYNRSGPIDPGINLGPTLFNWVTVQAAFNTMSSATGWEWSCDYNKVIRIYPPGNGTGPAPFNISENDGKVFAESLGIEYFRSQYRNRQGVIAPSGSTNLWTDTFSASDPGPLAFPQPPDGIRQNFYELYYFTAIPTVEVNGAPQTVINLETTPITTPGAQWYVLFGNQGSGQQIGYGLFQIPWMTPLGPTDVLTITYPLQLSPIYWVQDDAQIAIRAAIEGNTGVYEDVEQAPSVTDPTAIIAYAYGLLQRYGAQGIPFQVTYSGRLPGGLPAPLLAGQNQTLVNTNPPINFAGLISQVNWQDVDGQYMQLSVTLLSGNYLGNFTQFYAALIAHGQMPQPSAQVQYQILIAPSYPGITNPGITGGNYTTSVVIQNPVELVLTFNVFLPNAVTLGQVEFQLLNISQGLTVLGQLFFQPGQSGNVTFNASLSSPMRCYKGDQIQVLVGGSSGAIKDGVATFINSILIA